MTIAGSVGRYAMFHADRLLAQAPLSGDVVSLEEPATALAHAERLALSTPAATRATGDEASAWACNGEATAN